MLARTPKNLVHHLLIALGLLGAPAAFGDWCGDEYSKQMTDNGCTQENFNKNVCYELSIACGEYETVLANISGVSGALDTNQKYFAGLGYQGLYVKTMSKGQKCDYVHGAKTYLQGFLGDAQRSLLSHKAGATPARYQIRQ